MAETTETEQTTEQEQAATETEQKEQTFTQSELDSLIDKRTAKALETAKQKWEEEKQDAVNQAEKLAKLSAAERKEAEDKAKQEAMDKREQELNQREMRYEAQHQLEENELPTDFVDMVMSNDAEKVSENIANLKTAFNKAVEVTVNEKLRGKTPQTGTTAGRLTKQEILQTADEKERQRLIGENMDLFRK
ncbi:DUF4355 domain-containing protein [Weissella paramesenteroides]|uniref:DUF4355 domain-containing protein n=1 Tax=Weissella paramesenteroides TaxID=1249 RepID=UPI00123953F8|nr:DUF4355 domain-containing protein [Weissella paramesenteroides]KAA8442651.1 DUF4355 domain-containing protein [Weissella paramesenteroides]KAA8442997.1 DUF4355 domain-containing protein [Weissella paramesenteroides]KAA8444327.1 DUF4355 domain-containing protein [Weissella paramesenteroides]KAA8447995.1 DUF4355 domain-containing protein [Weissella paramesenteroides]KAA8452192.1 DUF4355 domain-containing protein [Weissella paramesenteroides]